MTTPSPSPTRVVLQPRDRCIFASMFTHRYLTAQHIHELHVAGQAAPRRTYSRLRRLWQATYLERTRVVREDWLGKGNAPPSQLLYALATKGAQAFADTADVDLANIPHTPKQNAHGFATLQHHLVVTDYLVALEVALSSTNTNPATLVSIKREHVLRRELGAHAMHTEVPRPWLIPDGAFSLDVEDIDEPVTFYVEIVRSMPVGGREAFFEKLTSYLDALKVGTLPRVWNHTQVGAVLILAPTPERAERLRVQAERLPRHADRFWFASYLTEDELGTKTNALTASTVLTPMWRDGTGAERTLIHP